MKDLPLVFFAILLSFSASSQSAADSIDARIARYLHEGAWDAVLSSIQQQPESRVSVFELSSGGYAAYQSGEKELAADYYDEVLDKDSVNVQALYYRALIYKEGEQYTSAISLLARLCGSKPKVAAYHSMLGDCYLAANDKEAAILNYAAAHTLSPLQAGISVKLANALAGVKQYARADTILRSAMAAQRGNPALLNVAIKIAYQRKEYSRTSSLTDSIILTQKPTYNALLTGLYADMEAKNYTHAIHLGELAAALGGESEEVLYYTALAHQNLKHWQKSEELLRACLSIAMKPAIGEYYKGLAEASLHTGNLRRGNAYYDTAFYLFKDPQVLYLQARAMEEGGRKDIAKAAYRHYLRLPAKMQDTSIARYAKEIIKN